MGQILLICFMKENELKDINLENLGKRIKELRIRKGYSNYENFAYDNNISRSQFVRYENGKDIRFYTLLRIIAAFDMSIKDFFSEGFD